MININEPKKKQCESCIHKDICKYFVLIPQAIADMEEHFNNRCDGLPITMTIQCDNFTGDYPVTYRKNFMR